MRCGVCDPSVSPPDVPGAAHFLLELAFTHRAGRGSTSRHHGSSAPLFSIVVLIFSRCCPVASKTRLPQSFPRGLLACTASMKWTISHLSLSSSKASDVVESSRPHTTVLTFIVVLVPTQGSSLRISKVLSSPCSRFQCSVGESFCSCEITAVGHAITP